MSKRTQLVTVAFSVFAACQLHANLVVDGGFNGPLTVESGSAADVTIPGWFAPAAGLSISGGVGNLASAEGFGQFFENLTGLSVGHTYDISFQAMSGSPTGGTVAVNFDHTGSVAQFFTTPGASFTTYDFKSTVADLNANGSVTLAFTGVSFDFSGGPGFGALTLDNVSVTDTTAVPEPSTYVAGALLLLPFGAGAFRKLRKNKKA